MDKIEQAREALRLLEVYKNFWPDVRDYYTVHEALTALSTPVDGVGAEPVAYMHRNGAIWRLDNCPAGMDFSEPGWTALAPLASPEAEARLRERVHYAEGTAQANIDRANEAERRAEAAEARLAQAERGPAVTEAWLRDTVMNVMLATEVEEAIRILEAALHPLSAAGEEGKP